MRPILLTVLAMVVTAGGHASAQTALVRTLADGAASRTIQAGQSVTISVLLTHNQMSLAGLAGGTVVTGDAGVASTFRTELPALMGTVFGEFRGGSRVGADMRFPNLSQIAFPPPVYAQQPVPVWQYELRLDEAGTYAINWESPATAPNARVYANT